MTLCSRALPWLLCVVVVVVAACSSLPPQPDVFYFDENAMAPLPSTPMVEYPPIEPVQMPPPVEPTPAPELPPSAEDNVAKAAPPASATASVPSPSAATDVARLSDQPKVVTEQHVYGAALMPAPPPAPAIPPEDLEALALMRDLTHYGGLSSEEVKREISTVSGTFRVDRNDANRIRLAVLFTLTHSPQDDLRAQQLLENVAKSGGSSSALKHLAAVLQTQVSERTRAWREEATRANEAVQKLEALRQMERSLLRDRISSGGGGAGGGTGGGGQ